MNKTSACILLCGHMRDFQNCYLSFYDNLLAPLRKVVDRIDIIVSTWSTLNPKHCHATLNGVHNELTDIPLDVEKVKQYYKPIQILIDDYELLKEQLLVKNFTDKIPTINVYKDGELPTIPQFYRIFSANVARQIQEDTQGYKYDLVVRWRPDFCINKPINFIIDNNIHTIQYEPGVSNDQFFYGDSENMAKMCSIFQNLSYIYNNYPNDMGGERVVWSNIQKENIPVVNCPEGLNFYRYLPKQMSKLELIKRDVLLGKPVLLIDQPDRENEVDGFLAGEFATPENINWLIQYCKGLSCITCKGDRLDRLGIGMMLSNGMDKFHTPFAALVDASKNVKTGMSAKDRCETIKVLLNPNSKLDDLSFPGHVPLLRAKCGLLRERTGHTEFSITMLDLFGLTPVGVICEVIKSTGDMLRGDEAEDFAKEHGLNICYLSDVLQVIQ